MIKQLQAGDAQRWDRYVMVAEQATFFHLSAWRQVIEQAFGHRSHYLFAEENGEIVGILPLVHINSRLFGNSLISNAFCVYGGIVADNADVFAALSAHAQQLARDLGVDYLELRNLRQSQPDWPCKPLYVTFIKTLQATAEANFQALPRKRRTNLRAASKAGLQAVTTDDLDSFYRCYAESVRNLGTPVFAKRYFQLLQQAFGEACEILLVHHQGKPVAGVMSFDFRDQVRPN